ncbi:DUF2634 domain-containing protein [Clostridium sp. MSJ-11]|uniref:DUF2634 domain-containing protein n=1 Tax=Clostridium mobile TaxID=2841512 RepID=A0ABS6EMW2_9CLOT|nr:DUF2634 domain-containing protein [Clostridium mobile]MBU5486462.1 DUF2634 domain-containing protein [Clostridium mobile]
MSNVSILPQGAIISDNLEVEEVIEPTKTYKIDFEKGKVVGICDDVEALKQAIQLILNTERYEHLIYSWNYGSELKDLTGKDRDITESEIKRRVTEALIQDERINNIDNFIFKYDKDGVIVDFTVFSIYGDFEVTKEV